MKAARGFSLLEVLLAAAVLAAALGVLLSIVSRGLRDVGDAGSRGEAVLHLQTLLDNAGRVQRLRAGEQGGVLEGKYRWRLQVRPVPSPWPAIPALTATPDALEGQGAGIAAELWQLDGEVAWGSGEAEQVRASTLRAHYPLPEEAGTR